MANLGMLFGGPLIKVAILVVLIITLICVAVGCKKGTTNCSPIISLFIVIMSFVMTAALLVLQIAQQKFGVMKNIRLGHIESFAAGLLAILLFIASIIMAVQGFIPALAAGAFFGFVSMVLCIVYAVVISKKSSDNNGSNGDSSSPP